MRSFTKILVQLALPVFIISASACGSTNQSQPAAEAVTAYLEALVQKEENAMINQACAQWESQAKLEFDSFAAVKVALEGPGCSETGQDGSVNLVTCSGKIIASYGEEDLIIDLAERTYQVVNEGGEWRMCGYR